MGEPASVLFLGSGATVGSGITKTRQCKKLPADNFFQSPIVGQILAQGGYPALSLVREQVNSLRDPSLFRTWNDLFIHRSLGWSGILMEDPRWLADLQRYRWPDNYALQSAR